MRQASDQGMGCILMLVLLTACYVTGWWWLYPTAMVIGLMVLLLPERKNR